MRQLGYPTANIRVPQGKALPLGVFAVTAQGDHGVWHGMANVGFRPTVNGTERRFKTALAFVAKSAFQLDSFGLDGAEDIRQGRLALLVARARRP